VHVATMFMLNKRFI